MQKIEKIKVGKDSSIREALQKISAGALRIAIVVDEDNILQGTITDGDIRSALLRDFTLEDSIETIYNKNPIVCYENDDNTVIIEKAIEKKIHQIPIVNYKNQVIGIEEINELIQPKRKENIAVIMVGGLGTRLRPLTEKTPKPMLHVGNKPILHTIIDNFKKYGFVKIVLCVNYKSDIIEEYFGDGKSFGIELEYIYEESRMGTAGALSLLKSHPVNAFFVMNGDLLTNINFDHLLEFHENTKAVATMCTREYEYEIPYGVVNVEDDAIQSIVEKPSYSYFVNGGIYILDPLIFNYLPTNEFFDMPSLFNMLIEDNKRCSSFNIKDYWLDIGRISDYEKANVEYHSVFKN